jgi:hypothetical protein
LLVGILAGLLCGCTRPAPEAPEPPAPAGADYGVWVDEHRAPGVADNTSALRDFLAHELAPHRERLDAAFRFAQAQIEHTAALMETRPLDDFPLRTDPLTGEWSMADTTYWTSGHWVGQLWLLRQATGDERYTRWALPKAQRIGERVREMTATHDHGFLFGLSHVQGLRFVEDADRARLREDTLTAARTYLSKQNPYNGLVHWHGSYEEDLDEPLATSIVDSMMNVPLLWWASEQTGDGRFREAGLRHTEAIRSDLVRPNFSTVHGVDFDPRNGHVLGLRSHQGYAIDSTWSRGQAWGIYGFTIVYAKTGQRRWLETARGLADFYLSHPRLPADRVPYWDFDAPGDDQPRDTSAAAVAAAGLQQLARFEDDRGRAERYLHESTVTLVSLASPPYSAQGTNDQALVRHGCRNLHKGELDNGLVFGDYYFLEALVHALDW